MQPTQPRHASDPGTVLSARNTGPAARLRAGRWNPRSTSAGQEPRGRRPKTRHPRLFCRRAMHVPPAHRATRGSPRRGEASALRGKVHPRIVRMVEHMFGYANIVAAPAGRLLVHLGRRYREDAFVREIARSVGLGVGPVSEALRLLAAGHHLERIERGRNVYYRANLESGLVRAVKLAATLAELDELLRALAPNVHAVTLFGSCATGEDTVESDIDLCIVTEEPGRVDAALARHPIAGGRPVSAIVLGPDEFLALGQRDPALAERIRQGWVAWEATNAL